MGRKKMADAMRRAWGANILQLAYEGVEPYSELPVGALAFGKELGFDAKAKSPGVDDRDDVYWVPLAQPGAALAEPVWLAERFKDLKRHVKASLKVHGLEDASAAVRGKRAKAALSVAGLVGAGVLAALPGVNAAVPALVLAAAGGLAKAAADGQVDLYELADVAGDVLQAGEAGGVEGVPKVEGYDRAEPTADEETEGEAQLRALLMRVWAAVRRFGAAEVRAYLAKLYGERTASTIMQRAAMLAGGV